MTRNLASLHKAYLKRIRTAVVCLYVEVVGRREAVVDLGILPQITPATDHDTPVSIDISLLSRRIILSSQLSAHNRYRDLNVLVTRIVFSTLHV